MTYTLKTHGMITTDIGAPVGGNAELFELDGDYKASGAALATAALGLTTGVWNLSYATANPAKDYLVQITPSTPTSQQKRFVLMTNEHTSRELTVLSTTTLLGPIVSSGNVVSTGTVLQYGPMHIYVPIEIGEGISIDVTGATKGSVSVGAAAGGGGSLSFGPGAPSAEDTNLYRSAAHTLKTNDNLEVSLTLAVTGATTLRSTLDVTGALAVTGAATLRSTLNVTGTLTAGIVKAGSPSYSPSAGDVFAQGMVRSEGAGYFFGTGEAQIYFSGGNLYFYNGFVLKQIVVA